MDIGLTWFEVIPAGSFAMTVTMSLSDWLFQVKM
jgi:hypothetical protein